MLPTQRRATGSGASSRLAETVAPTGARPAGFEARRLAAELAPMVDVWRRLLVQHVPDGAGRCRTCTKGGTGLPSVRWPCSLHGIAELARRRYDGGR